jgi:hypothetical protein
MATGARGAHDTATAGAGDSAGDSSSEPAAGGGREQAAAQLAALQRRVAVLERHLLRGGNGSETPGEGGGAGGGDKGDGGGGAGGAAEAAAGRVGAEAEDALRALHPSIAKFLSSGYLESQAQVSGCGGGGGEGGERWKSDGAHPVGCFPTPCPGPGAAAGAPVPLRSCTATLAAPDRRSCGRGSCARSGTAR